MSQSFYFTNKNAGASGKRPTSIFPSHPGRPMPPPPLAMTAPNFPRPQPPSMPKPLPPGNVTEFGRPAGPPPEDNPDLDTGTFVEVVRLHGRWKIWRKRWGWIGYKRWSLDAVGRAATRAGVREAAGQWLRAARWQQG